MNAGKPGSKFDVGDKLTVKLVTPIPSEASSTSPCRDTCFPPLLRTIRPGKVARFQSPVTSSIPL